MNKTMHRGRTEYSHLTSETVALVLAGGNGTRLKDLTRWDAKPAGPFGGIYRNIDFSLSNSVNSGIRRIGVLTQYKSRSLIEHLQEGAPFVVVASISPRDEVAGMDHQRGLRLAAPGITDDARVQTLDRVLFAAARAMPHREIAHAIMMHADLLFLVLARVCSVGFVASIT